MKIRDDSPPKLSVSSFTGYYVSTVGLNEDTIKKYIQDQKKADIMMDKLSVKEYEDPFRG